MQPPPFPAQIEDCQFSGPSELDRNIDRWLRHLATATHLDAVAADIATQLTVPAMKPRTLCCCQFVACIMSSMLAPSG